MRLIGHLPDERLARRFADVLLVKSMASQVEPEADGRWAVWVHDDDHLDEATSQLQLFSQRPDDSRYLSAVGKAGEIRLREQQELATRLKRQEAARLPSERTWVERLGICTLALLSITVGVFCVQLVNEALIWKWLGIVTITPAQGDLLEWSGEGFLPEVRSGQIWRLVTPIFVHGGPLHLVMNLLLLAQLAGAVEFRYGWSRLLVLILCVSVFSNLLEYVFNHPAFCGMSGVVFGLFGFVWTQWKYHPESGFAVPPHVTFMFLFWFVACIVGVAGNIANFVHWGGLASGAVIGYVAAVLSRPR